MKGLGLVAAAAVAAIVVVAGALEVAAALDRRRLRPPCPLDDEVPPPWPARVVTTLARFAAECVAIGRAALAPLVPRRTTDASAAVRGAVVLVPGTRALAPAMRFLQDRLARDGWVATIAPPSFGARDLGTRAATLDAALAAVRRATGGARVDVVAHGTGGLVARTCLAADGRATGVGRLVTLGTPHQGSVAFRWLRLDPLAAAHCPSAPALVQLGEDDRIPDRVDCIAIASADDALTVPVDRAYWPGAFNVTIEGVGHVGLLYADRVYELVRENLAAAPAPVRTSRPA